MPQDVEPLAEVQTVEKLKPCLARHCPSLTPPQVERLSVALHGLMEKKASWRDKEVLKQPPYPQLSIDILVNQHGIVLSEAQRYGSAAALQTMPLVTRGGKPLEEKPLKLLRRAAEILQQTEEDALKVLDRSPMKLSTEEKGCILYFLRHSAMDRDFKEFLEPLMPKPEEPAKQNSLRPLVPAEVTEALRRSSVQSAEANNVLAAASPQRAGARELA